MKDQNQYHVRLGKVTPKRIPMPSREEMMRQQRIWAEEDKKIMEAIEKAVKKGNEI